MGLPSLSGVVESVFGKGSSGWPDKRASPMGDMWSGEEAAIAHQRGELRSGGSGKKVRLAFRNLTPFPLILCWVSNKGELRHFYHMPSTLKQSEEGPNQQGSSTTLLESDHIESTIFGHAFCLACVESEEDAKAARKRQQLPAPASIIAGYRPTKETMYNLINSRSTEEGKVDDRTLLITVRWQSHDQADMICCLPFAGFAGGLRGTRKRRNNDAQRPEDGEWIVIEEKAIFDRTPFDSTTKRYKKDTMGGWPVRLEENWHGGNPDLEKRLASDIEAAAKLLPDHAREYLQEHCAIWVNKSIKYGPKVCPVTGIGCCYHPDQCWLVDNGMHAEKAKCIEINASDDYWKDKDLWQPGGLILHELGHAYHHGMIEGGYRNEEIIRCYEDAMDENLYECVAVHGRQGPKAEAYACSNAMEYFAELSAAFLGGLNDDVEFNKWYPFNRKQLKEHDPKAYKLLARLWKVDCE
mmetsp:Transcript_12381/g.35934  ORF Transcript_12381/g.35934 Transcript_12381/m.35934 type:complete len:467 (+) Transcript_12381:130-1530(+)|eukprot:CAMPEP_0119562290 /NCGR_PEP_ID=MMETSP1352-20130426/19971_1 /TAXON_ID=265584 /ORGANISM="Stauroneis constricta, Strain CCMP1120" /LENGTH=466 /DNA_ID=CAMNT_0007610651 /DNA_START=94 /DNA_END=1494 /DNA_ORIENTATION=+